MNSEHSTRNEKQLTSQPATRIRVVPLVCLSVRWR